MMVTMFCNQLITFQTADWIVDYRQLVRVHSVCVEVVMSVLCIPWHWFLSRLEGSYK